MKYKENWADTKERFKTWWNHEKMERPILNIVARRKEPLEETEPVLPAENPRDFHMDADRITAEIRNTCRTHKFMAEAFPYINIDIGPGAIAAYLGSEPDFTWDTVWYGECIQDWSRWNGFKFNPDNYWWKLHIDQITKAQQLSCGEFLVGIPDLIENIDIVSAMHGPQNTCYDLIDEPQFIKSAINQIDDLYFKYYDAIYDIVKLNDGSSCYIGFSIWGPGRTAKVQCDFSALMSPSQFREFVLPSLQKQCRQLDNSLYHLDGPDAVRHLDALMEISELDALQWTSGAGRPDGASELWYPIYEKVRKAGKSLWISFSDGTAKDWIKGADKIVKTFGNQGMYFLFPEMEEEEAKRIIASAEDRWSC